jgi:hypothetical protein
LREGFVQSQKKDLTGGGIISSFGGKAEVREVLKGGVYLMSDSNLID